MLRQFRYRSTARVSFRIFGEQDKMGLRWSWREKPEYRKELSSPPSPTSHTFDQCYSKNLIKNVDRQKLWFVSATSTCIMLSAHVHTLIHIAYRFLGKCIKLELAVHLQKICRPASLSKYSLFDKSKCISTFFLHCVDSVQSLHADSKAKVLLACSCQYKTAIVRYCCGPPLWWLGVWLYMKIYGS